MCLKGSDISFLDVERATVTGSSEGWNDTDLRGSQTNSQAIATHSFPTIF